MHRKGVEVIDGNVEKSLQLLGVQIHGQHALNSGGRQKVGHQLRGDGHAWLILAVLACIAEKRDHRRDAGGTRSPGGIHQDQELHQVLVGGRAGRLDDEDVAAANVFVDLDEGFAVRKRTYRRIARATRPR